MNNRQTYFILTVFLSFFGWQVIYAQQTVNSTILNETFKNNDRGWQIIQDDSINVTVTGNKYLIDYRQMAPWNKKIGLPQSVSNCLNNEEGEISFDLKIINRNGANTSAVGFTFDNDKKNNNYNVIYIGEENGKIFSSIIPHSNGAFGAPIKDGKAINFKMGSPYHIQIEKEIDNYKILINGFPIWSFRHQGNIIFANLYFTTGEYEISNLVAIKKTFSVDHDNSEGEKAFDPSAYKMYILLAGIDSLENFRTLNSPLLDIKAMKKFWQENAGGSVPAQNIISLANKQATRENLTKKLRTLAKKATANDVLIVYLTGHGAKNGYFICYDNPLTYVDLNEIIADSKAKNKLIILDACYSGYLRNIITSPEKGTPTPDDMLTAFKFDIAMTGKNTSYLVSCSDSETSFDGKPNHNSVFTEALLETVRSKGNRSPGEIVTLAEVYNALNLYFEKWNKEQSSKKVSDTLYVNNVQTILHKKTKSMHPQLISSNNTDNLPFLIVQKK